MGEIRIVGPGKTHGYPYPVCKKIWIVPELYCFNVGDTLRYHCLVVVVVVLLFYVHGKHLRSCRDGQLT